MRETIERAVLAINCLLIVFLAFLAFRAGGPGRAAVDSWLAERRVARTLRSQWSTIARSSSRVDAGSVPVRLVEFSDYQCPYCKQNHQEIVALLRRDSSIGVGYRHFPLANHTAAMGAARAAVCAESQGRFAEMHARLFTTELWQADTNWLREAVAAGVRDTLVFRACLGDSATATRIDTDIALGRSLGVEGTPTFFSSRLRRSGFTAESTLVSLVR